MRELTHCELNHIAGGMNCIDSATFQRMQEKAYSDGIVAGVLLSVLASAGTFFVTNTAAFAAVSAVNPIVASVVVGVTVAPYAFNFGYFNSSTWTMFS